MLNRCRLLVVAAVTLLLAACASAPKEHPLRYLLPAPPDKPRVEWLNTYASQDDFPKTEAQKRMEAILGKPPLENFAGPSAIASDGEGKVFVGDLYLRNIMVYDLVNYTVSKLIEGNLGLEPRQIVIDSKKQLYVADSAGNTVRVFSRDGRLLRSYGSSTELTKPLGVAIDEARGRVYVSDGPKSRVQVFDLASGKLLSTIGSEQGSKEGQLYNPVGLGVAKNGDLYVVELLNARISIFSPEGTFLRFFGERTDSLRGFENPRHLAFDSEGNVWLIDFRRGAMRAFNAEGELLFALEDGPDHKMGFWAPSAIFVDENDEVFIADFMVRRFSHWRYLGKANLDKHPITEEDLARIRQEVGAGAKKK